MNIYKKEYIGSYGGGMILIAAYTAEQADEISAKLFLDVHYPPDLSQAEKLENSLCYNENAGVIASNYYIE